MKRLCCVLLSGGLFFAAGAVVAQVSPKSAETYARGIELFDKKQFHDALAAFQDAVRLDGRNAQAHRAVGRTYRKLKDYPRAEEAYRAATTVKPDYVAAWYELGQLQVQCLKSFADAQSSLRQVLKADPEFDGGKARNYLTAAYLKEGDRLFRQHDYHGAARQYGEATQIAQCDAAAFYNLGLAHWQARKPDASEEALLVATDLNPGHSKALKVLGDVQKADGRTDQAARSYLRAIEADGDYAAAYLSLALLHLDADSPEKAVAVLRTATRVLPGNGGLWGALGSAHARRSDHASAVASYSEALRLNGKNPEMHYRLAVSHLELKNYGDALTSAQKALGTRYDVPAHVVLGDVYSRMRPEGWKEKAVAHYRAGLESRKYQKYCEDMIAQILDPAGEDEPADGS